MQYKHYFKKDLCKKIPSSLMDVRKTVPRKTTYGICRAGLDKAGGIQFNFWMLPAFLYAAFGRLGLKKECPSW